MAERKLAARRTMTTSIRSLERIHPTLPSHYCQKGLRSIRHEAGVLVGQETDVRGFHQWVRERLAGGEQP